MSLLTARPSSEFVEEDPFFLDVNERPNWQDEFKNLLQREKDILRQFLMI